MDVQFAGSQLARRYDVSRDAVRAWGPDVARRYIQRINQIMAAPNVSALSSLTSARFHPLKGTRRGEYALDLHGRWRLIVTIEGDTVTVQEVSNHYDD